MNPITEELISECKRQHENCQYTAVTFTIWLKYLKFFLCAGITISFLAGAFASWKIVNESSDPQIQFYAALAAFIAGIIPTLLAALKIEESINLYKKQAAEYTNLRDDFRLAFKVHSKKSFDEFELIFKQLMTRVEILRKESLTPPECIFCKAHRKIKQGHYNFSVDEEKSSP